MSLLRILGFDSFPTSMVNTYQPALRAGLQPFIDLYGITTISTSTSDSSSDGLGVSNRASELMSNGNKPLVFWRTNQNRVASMTIPGSFASATGASPYNLTAGFRFRALAQQIAGATTWPTVAGGRMRLAQFGVGAGAYQIALEVANNGALILNNTSIRNLELGREYYIELQIRNDEVRTGNYTPTLVVFIDGQQVYSGQSLSTLAAADAVAPTLRLGFTPSVSDGNTATAQQRWAYSDIYLLDGSGEAPYNDVLGPQSVMNVPIKGVTSNTWDVPAGETALSTITGANQSDDTKFLTAGGDASLQVSLDNPVTDATKQINGLVVFGRTARTASSSHQIETQLRVGNEPAAAGPTSHGPGTAFKANILTQLLPSTFADAMKIRRQVLDAATLQIDAKL